MCLFKIIKSTQSNHNSWIHTQIKRTVWTANLFRTKRYLIFLNWVLFGLTTVDNREQNVLSNMNYSYNEIIPAGIIIEAGIIDDNAAKLSKFGPIKTKKIIRCSFISNLLTSCCHLSIFLSRSSLSSALNLNDTTMSTYNINIINTSTDFRDPFNC